MGSREKAFLTLVDGEAVVGARKKTRADRKPNQSVRDECFGLGCLISFPVPGKYSG